jgi:(R,R)-butanediol dehydrogenase/meso-butanediol dehydrogenase/diacetyl reductase
VVEPDERRRQRAEQLGLATMDGGEDLPKRARRALGDGGAPVVVDSTGVAAVAPVAVECAARGGRIVLVGLPTASSQVEMRRLTLFERSLVGSLGYRYDLQRVLAMVAAGTLDPTAVLDGTVPLAEAGGELERIAADHGGTIKGMVKVR